jgi:hypothetical protein|tara:strand:+ start:344 stop:688 length:345 start_codon:yes stop_codon:yes gene_type:complete
MKKKLFNLELQEKRIGRKYRKEIFKKIAHLTFSEKKIILKLTDDEFLTKGLAILDTPRKSVYMTHYDRFYLSSRLQCIDIAMDKMKKVERLQRIQKRKSNIKLVWTNNKKKNII